MCSLVLFGSDPTTRIWDGNSSEYAFGNETIHTYHTMSRVDPAWLAYLDVEQGGIVELQRRLGPEWNVPFHSKYNIFLLT